MLAQMTSHRFHEWYAYYKLHPFGPEFENRRFALLAEVIAAGGHVTVGKEPLNRSMFLRMLQGDSLSQKKVKPQSVSQMEIFLKAWIDGSNKLFQEQPQKVG